jgi:DNA-binding PadR family transcriptional regulator
MSYALREMEKDGRVVKTVEKRKNYYELVEGV